MLYKYGNQPLFLNNNTNGRQEFLLNSVCCELSRYQLNSPHTTRSYPKPTRILPTRREVEVNLFGN